MKKQRRIAFDMSAFLWNALLTGKDDENGYKAVHEGKEVWINSQHHGYDIVVPRIIEVLKTYRCTPIDMIMVFEGKNSKAKRLMIDAGYKQGRDHPADSYTEFLALRDRVKKLFLELGAQAMTQDYAEGDDTLAWLAANTEDDLVIATFDNDIAALNGTNAYGANVLVWINGQDGGNKYGPFDHHLITTYKALVGDSGDKIKGCVGFGPKKFEEFVAGYGYDGLQELHDMLSVSDLSPLGPMAASGLHKLITMIVEQGPQVIKSFDLARLRPEWVQTKAHPITWEAGMVRQLAPDDRIPELRKWYGRARLVDASSFKAACDWALPLIRASREVALDIETTTPDESTEWLAAQGDIDGVDVFGSTLCGLGLTFGDNNQYTLYFSVDHADTDNIASEDLRQFIAQIPKEIPLVIQNVSFELAVLFNEWGDRQMDNGFHGFLPNVLDSKFEANYVNENMKTGLKERSLHYLGYRQQTYDETTLLTDAPENLPRGGRLITQTYLKRTVGTGKFEQLPVLDPETGVHLLNEDQTAGLYIDGPEITKEELVLVGTGRFEVEEDGTPKVDKHGDPVEIMEPVIATETRRYKMHELSANHVFGYGADDPICTIALHNFYKLNMQLEHQYQVCLDVEIDAAYQHAKNFIDGVPFSAESMQVLVKEDDATFDAAWATFRSYLISKGWEGTQPPVYTADITAAQVKEAFEIVTGKPMGTMMRTVSKLAKFAEIECDQPIFGGLLAALDKEGTLEAVKAFSDYVLKHFKGEPIFNSGSPKQKENLMYTVMGLPIRVRNKATEQMRAAGIYEGNPKTDVLAIAYALRDCAEHIKEASAPGMEETRADWQQIKDALEAMKLMSMVNTRRSLYYSKYPAFMHWKDGRIRSSHNQAATNTRRASESGPNKQQLPKHAKIEGQDSKFRCAIVPHRPGAVVVSIDFDQQELANIAKQSQCPELLACFLGENPRKMHGITGVGIAKDLRPDIDWTYELVMEAKENKEHPLHATGKEAYNLGKKVNFTSEYGAQAPKVAATLLITEEKAQEFLDFREDSFPGVVDWKEDTIREAKLKGFVRTMRGAVRHLRDALMSDDRFEASKAERQAVNFKVQSSCAEQTKEAEGRMWRDNLFYDFDAVCYGPIHDEIVASVMIEDLVAFLPRMHACMVADYAGMSVNDARGVAVPIKGSISFGPNFYHQTEIGLDPTPEAIAKGLVDMAAATAKREAKEREKREYKEAA
jgi:hypothetical protein